MTDEKLRELERRFKETGAHEDESAWPNERFSICAALAELERSIVAERSVEGQRRARARGTHVGRPRREVDELRIRELHTGGESLRAIARATEVSRTVVTRVVREAA